MALAARGEGVEIHGIPVGVALHEGDPPRVRREPREDFVRGGLEPRYGFRIAGQRQRPDIAGGRSPKGHVEQPLAVGRDVRQPDDPLVDANQLRQLATDIEAKDPGRTGEPQMTAVA